jgi:hypothetical protein
MSSQQSEIDPLDQLRWIDLGECVAVFPEGHAKFVVAGPRVGLSSPGNENRSSSGRVRRPRSR